MAMVNTWTARTISYIMIIQLINLIMGKNSTTMSGNHLWKILTWLTRNVKKCCMVRSLVNKWSPIIIASKEKEKPIILIPAIKKIKKRNRRIYKKDLEGSMLTMISLLKMKWRKLTMHSRTHRLMSHMLLSSCGKDKIKRQQIGVLLIMRNWSLMRNGSLVKDLLVMGFHSAFWTSKRCRSKIS